MSDTESSSDSDSDNETPKKVLKTADIKAYRKAYYQKNKAKIMAQVLAKEQCPICSRMINHQQMKRHQKSKSCCSKVNEIDDIKQQIKIMQDMLKTKK
jgi:hypothetical protein